ncbi:MAG: hypothetical protein AAF693_21215 [Bacteroidota bacterium]
MGLRDYNLILIAYLLIAHSVVVSFSQSNSQDCLSPIGSHHFGLSKVYHEKINEILLSQFSDFQVIRYQRNETFWAIELDTSDLEDPHYHIRRIRPSKSIWHRVLNPLTEDSIEVESYRKKMSEEDAALLIELFNKSLNFISSSCGSKIIIDGTSHTFSNMVSIGQVNLAYPLSASTRIEKLVLISQEIAAIICRSKRKKLELSKAIKRQIKKLIADF